MSEILGKARTVRDLLKAVIKNTESPKEPSLRVAQIIALFIGLLGEVIGSGGGSRR